MAPGSVEVPRRRGLRDRNTPSYVLAIILLFSTINCLSSRDRVFHGLNREVGLTENDTTGPRMRIRFTGVPRDGEFDEFDLRRFHVGEIYDVPTRLASLLIIAGYADLVSGGHQIAEAADFGSIRFPKPKR